MSFQFLAPHLHPTAEAAEAYFKSSLGARYVRHEFSPDAALPLRPTLWANLANAGILCVDVSERAYSNSLDAFVLECSAKALPVKLYVAIPSAKSDPDFPANLRKAKARGVGIVELGDGEPFVAAEAVSLSLFGLRRLELARFPKAKREAVRSAQETFLNGNPVKGCQALYDELEDLTRTFAKRSYADGWWRAPHQGETAPSTNFNRAWALVLKDLATFIDPKRSRKSCPAVDDGMIASVRGMTHPRNLTSHIPRTVAAVAQRDMKLRTWFESTGDLLLNWYLATQSLRL